MNTFGAPWLFGGSLYGFRKWPTLAPYQGSPVFLSAIEEEVLVVIWPWKASLSSGGSVKSSIDMFEPMSAMDASKIMSTHSKSCVLKPGNVMWVPPAFNVFVVSLKDNAMTLWQPVFDKDFMEKTMTAEEVQTFLSMNRTFVTNNQALAPWNSIGNAFLAFLDTFSSK